MTLINHNSNKYKVVGTRPIRHDALDKVTGKANYGADINLPGMLHGKVLRSPYAHAKIKSIDFSKLNKLNNIKAIATFKDLKNPGPTDMKAVLGQTPTHNIFAENKVLYKGHPILAIAATNLHDAEEALKLIDIEYDVLQPTTNVEDSISKNAPILHDNWIDPLNDKPTNIGEHQQFKSGNIDDGFQKSDNIFEKQYTTKTVHQGYIELQNATAWWTNDQRVTIWCSTQGHFGVRDNTARILGIPVSDIKVVPMEIGGGFGGKIAVYLEPIAAILSKKSGQPVKLTMTRSEVLEATGPTSGSIVNIKIGYTNQGIITGAKADIFFEAGAFPGGPIGGACAAIFAPYDIKNVLINAYDVVTNKPRTTAYRAPGAPIVCFAVESALDEISKEINIDPIDIRLLNVAEEGSRRADGVVNLKIGAKEVMEALKKHPHYLSPVKGPNIGRGIGMGFCRNNTGPACAVANVLNNGTITLVEGSIDLAGSRTAVSQQLAEVLGIPVEKIIPQVGDTDTIGYTSNTGGSGVVFKTGWAAYEAAQDIIQQLIKRAAKIWDTNEKDIEYIDGILKHKIDTELQITFEEIAELLSQTGGPVVGKANLNPGGSGGSYAANIVDLEVDPDTGKVTILRFTAFQDVGTAIHPSYVEGQIQGGTSQGIGWALNEEYFMNEKGELENTSLLDYRMPTSLDLPPIEAVIVEVPNPGHPFGVRGVGEANIVPPLAAIGNAIEQALGIRMYDLPMNPQSLLLEINKQKHA